MAKTIVVQLDEADIRRLEVALAREPLDPPATEALESYAAGIVAGAVYHTSRPDADDGARRNQAPPAA